MTPKIAIITGGSGYLGRAVTAQLRERAWVVISLARSEISGEFQCDVSDADSVRTAISHIMAKYGHIHAVIHAASPKLERVPTEKASAKSAGEHMQVALDGARNLLDIAGAHIANGGVFIGVTTSAVRAAKPPAMGGYVAAKQAMEEFLKERAEIEKRFRILTFEVGFLPGGLNGDLPKLALEMFSKKSESVESVAKRIADICES